MKFIMVIGDGMSDYPVDELGGKTPLQVADHPNMDEIASRGVCGTLKTVPEGMDIVTDVAVLSILGYDPLKYCVGRGPLEAASMGVDLFKGDIAFRCNLVTVMDGLLCDYSAGHIDTEDARELIGCVHEALGVPELIQLYGGVSYRHLLVFRGGRYSERVKCFPPHDVMGSPVSKLMVSPLIREAEETAEVLNEMMIKSREVLSTHLINRRRMEEGKKPANMIWPWSPGRKPDYPTLQERYGLSGAVISAVDVIKGIGIYAGMDVVEVPGATGYIDTNYEGKAEYALKSLEDHDFVLVHVEAPDEAGHTGSHDLKIRTIEDLDRRLLGPLFKGMTGDFTLAILPDHPTPVSVKTHTSDPVPFAVYSTTSDRRGPVDRFYEESVRSGGMGLIEGHRFFPLFLKREEC